MISNLARRCGESTGREVLEQKVAKAAKERGDHEIHQIHERGRVDCGRRFGPGYFVVGWVDTLDAKTRNL